MDLGRPAAGPGRRRRLGRLPARAAPPPRWLLAACAAGAAAVAVGCRPDAAAAGAAAARAPRRPRGARGHGGHGGGARRRPGGLAAAGARRRRAARSRSSSSWTATRTGWPGPGAPRCIADATVTALVDGAARTVGSTPRSCCSRRARSGRDCCPGEAVRARVGGRRCRAAATTWSPSSPPAGRRPRRGGRRRCSGPPARCGTGWPPRPPACSTTGPPACCRAWSSATPAPWTRVLAADFRRAGLSHLTAVSGANVAIVLAGVLWPLRRRAVDRRVQAVVAGLALAGFVVLARPERQRAARGRDGRRSRSLALASGRSRAAVPALGAAVVRAAARRSRAGPGRRLRAVGRRDRRDRAAGARAGRGGCASRGWPPVARRRAGRQRGRRTGHRAAGRRPVRHGQPRLAAGQPAGRPGGRAGHRARPAGARSSARSCRRWRDALVWLAGWPVRWLVLVAERAAAVPDARDRLAGRHRRRGAADRPAARRRLGCSGGSRGCGRWRWPRWSALVVLGWPLRQTVRGWPPADTGRGRLRRRAGRRARAAHRSRGRGARRRRARTSARSTGAWTGWASTRCRWSCSRTSTPTTPGGLAGALAGRDVGVVATGDAVAGRRPGRRPRPARRRRRRDAGRSLVPGDRRTVGDVRRSRSWPPTPARATAAAAPNDLSMVARVTVRGRPRPAHRRPRRRGGGPARRATASTCGPTSSRCRTTAAPTPTPTSWPPAAPASRWSRSGPTTPTATRPPGRSRWLAAGRHADPPHRPGGRPGRRRVAPVLGRRGRGRRRRAGARGVRRPPSGRRLSRSLSVPRDTMAACRRPPWNPPRASGW